MAALGDVNMKFVLVDILFEGKSFANEQFKAIQNKFDVIRIGLNSIVVVTILKFICFELMARNHGY